MAARITIRLPEQLETQIKTAADQAQTTAAELARSLLERSLSNSPSNPTSEPTGEERVFEMLAELDRKLAAIGTRIRTEPRSLEARDEVLLSRVRHQLADLHQALNSSIASGFEQVRISGRTSREAAEAAATSSARAVRTLRLLTGAVLASLLLCLYLVAWIAVHADTNQDLRQTRPPVPFEELQKSLWKAQEPDQTQDHPSKKVLRPPRISPRPIRKASSSKRRSRP